MGYHKELYHKGLDYKMTFGKHEGKTLEQICKDDPEYIYWLRENPHILKIKMEVVTYANEIKMPRKPDF